MDGDFLENPIKIENSQGYHHFRKPPYFCSDMILSWRNGLPSDLGKHPGASKEGYSTGRAANEVTSRKASFRIPTSVMGCATGLLKRSSLIQNPPKDPKISEEVLEIDVMFLAMKMVPSIQRAIYHPSV